ncbi:pilin [Candidatus Parcubacteria bacterium]|nr:pilin [Candidatus Parcubacteria bacterium]
MKKLIYASIALTPALSFAQTSGTPTLGNLQVLLNSIQNLVKLALPIVIGLALLGFFWGLMKFIFSAGNEESKADGKKIMIYGVIALFVMVSVWGLVNFIGGSLGVGQGGTAPVPTVNGL